MLFCAFFKGNRYQRVCIIHFVLFKISCFNIEESVRCHINDIKVVRVDSEHESSFGSKFKFQIRRLFFAFGWYWRSNYLFVDCPEPHASKQDYKNNDDKGWDNSSRCCWIFGLSVVPEEAITRKEVNFLKECIKVKALWRHLSWNDYIVLYIEA